MNTKLRQMKLFKACAVAFVLGSAIASPLSYALKAEKVKALAKGLRGKQEIANSRYMAQTSGNVRRAIQLAFRDMEQAIAFNDHETIREWGRDVLVQAILNSMTNCQGWTLLHMAVKVASKTNDLSVIEALLEIGVLLESPDDNQDKTTPLEAAYSLGNQIIIDCLKNRGATLKRERVVRNRGIKRARIDNIVAEEEEKEWVASFLQELSDSFKQKPAQRPRLIPLLLEDRLRDFQSAEATVEQAVKVAFDEEVMGLIRRGDWDTLVVAIMNRSVDVQWVDKFGSSFLIHAAGTGRVDLVETFIQLGVPVNAINKVGYTALMVAVEGSYVEVVKMLIDSGADIGITHYNRATGIEYNVLTRSIALRELYAPRGLFGSNSLSPALYDNQCKIVSMLFQKEEDIAFERARERAAMVQQEEAAAQQALAMDAGLLLAVSQDASRDTSA